MITYLVKFIFKFIYFFFFKQILPRLVECFKKSGVLNYESKTSQKKQSRGNSEVTITWEIPKKQTSGNYQIVYYGDSKNRKGEITSFEGRSSQFKVYY